MKLIPILILLVCPAIAAPVQIAWNASPTPGVTYRIYAYTNAADVKQFDAGANLSTTLTNLTPGLWHVRATSILGSIESDPSPEIPFEIPAPPTNLRTVIVEQSFDLTDTNGFKGIGFFRLKIP